LHDGLGHLLRWKIPEAAEIAVGAAGQVSGGVVEAGLAWEAEGDFGALGRGDADPGGVGGAENGRGWDVEGARDVEQGAVIGNEVAAAGHDGAGGQHVGRLNGNRPRADGLDDLRLQRVLFRTAKEQDRCVALLRQEASDFRERLRPIAFVDVIFRRAAPRVHANQEAVVEIPLGEPLLGVGGVLGVEVKREAMIITTPMRQQLDEPEIFLDIGEAVIFADGVGVEPVAADEVDVVVAVSDADGRADEAGDDVVFKPVGRIREDGDIKPAPAQFPDVLERRDDLRVHEVVVLDFVNERAAAQDGGRAGKHGDGGDVGLGIGGLERAPRGRGQQAVADAGQTKDQDGFDVHVLSCPDLR